MLPYFTMFQWTICEFPVKKEQFLPTGADHGKTDTAGLQQRLLKENTKMGDEDSHSTNSSVSGDEGHSDPLRVAAETGARLSTPAKPAI